MATGSKTMAVTEDLAEVVGSGEGVGALLLCSITFQANERACKVRYLACSSAGDEIEGTGVGAVDPESGDLLLCSPLLTVAPTNNRIDFAVEGAAGVTWRGYLRVEAVHDYSA